MRNLKKIVFNSGIGLVEVLVAIGLMGGLAIGLMRLTENMSKSNAKANTDSDVLLATNEIISILSDPNNCKKTIPNVNANINSVSFQNKQRYKVGDYFGNSGTTITGYKLIYPGKSAQDGTLLVNYKKKAILGGGNTPRKIGLYLEVNPDKTVSHCRAVVFEPDIWTRGSGDWASDIFFHGRVGIGTSEPMYPLHVNNTMTTSVYDGTFSTVASEVFDDTNLHQSNRGHPVFFGLRSRGKFASPAYSKKDDILASFVGRDYLAQKKANGTPLYGGAGIYMTAQEDYSDNTLGSQIHFETTKIGEKQAKINMVIHHDGNIGISDRSPTERLSVNGKIKATGDIMSGGNVISSSDKRLKKDIKPLDNSLRRILQLQGVSYLWKDHSKNNTNKQVGLVAQDVGAVFPEVISRDKNGFWGIAYTNLIAPIIEAIKELNSEIKTLKEENQKLINYICQNDPHAPVCAKEKK